jgi:hypothetical protein
VPKTPSGLAQAAANHACHGRAYSSGRKRVHGKTLEPIGAGWWVTLNFCRLGHLRRLRRVTASHASAACYQVPCGSCARETSLFHGIDKGPVESCVAKKSGEGSPRNSLGMTCDSRRMRVVRRILSAVNGGGGGMRCCGQGIILDSSDNRRE